jgi:H+/Cl- antiporter ClcA
VSVRTTMSYLRSRLGERSTWLLIGAAIAAAAGLKAPWSAIFFVVGIIGALVPDGSVKPS